MGDDDRLHAKIQALEPVLARLRRGEGPTVAELAEAPVLTGWMVTADRCLIGHVAGHPRLPDGPITTSWLVMIGPDRSWARTISRWYRLGPSAMPGSG